jgi:hypothetical protein
MPKSIQELKPTTVGVEELRNIVVFSISFKVFHEEMTKWHWDTDSDLEGALKGYLMFKI